MGWFMRRGRRWAKQSLEDELAGLKAKIETWHRTGIVPSVQDVYEWVDRIGMIENQLGRMREIEERKGK